MFFPPYRRPCSAAFQFLIFLIFALTVIAGFAAFIIYLIQPHPPEFQIDAVSVSPFAISKARINAVWRINFHLRNPNYRTTITCEEVEIFACYKGVLLASATMASLHLPTDFHGLLTVIIPAPRPFLANDVANAIFMDWERGAVAFSFKVRSKISFDPSTLIEKKRWMTVACDNATIVSNLTGGWMMEGPPFCRLNL